MNNREGYTPPKYHCSSLDLPRKGSPQERPKRHAYRPATTVPVEADTRLGWTFRAQKEYVRRRFDNLRPIGNPVINHRVEQVLRALIWGFTVEGHDAALLSVHACGSSTFGLYSPEQVLQIGKLTRKGSALNAAPNSALAVLGFNGNAVLHWLSRYRVVDELTGFGDVAIINDGTNIFATYGVLANLARDVVFNRELVLSTYHEAIGYVIPEPKPRQ